jgi:hypothetical protein
VVVEPKLHDVEAADGAAALHKPVAGFAVACVPRGRVAQLVGVAQAHDVLDEAARVADLCAGFRARTHGVDAVTHAPLVGVAAIVKPEDFAQVVGGVHLSGVTPLDALPRELITIGTAGLLVGPVDGLLKVPEVGEVRALLGVGGRGPSRE